ncbi:MAG: HAD family phosphatase [Erysipelotrichaceae bacterium]|nr:HAD family phosphatase [Erysipelotrichaceae bacterium]
MVEAIIFDLDGLMVNTEQMTFALFQKVGKEHGIDVDVEFYKLLIGGDAETFKIAIKKYPYAYDVAEWARPYRNDFFYEFFPNPGDGNKPGLEELYRYLKQQNYKIAIASSSSRSYVDKVIHYLGFDMELDTYVGGDEVKAAKPEPDVFLKAAEKLHVDPKNCLVLEDSRNGIIAAQKANMPSLFIQDMVEPDELMKSYFIKQLDSLSDVITYLEEQIE